MNELSHPWLRIGGVALAAAIVFLLNINDPSPLHQLWLPLSLAVAAYLITQSAMAVAIAAFALATAHSDPEAASWIPSRAYPGIALISLVVGFGIAWNRFRLHIAATHEARWAARRQAEAEAEQSSGADEADKADKQNQNNP
ncbi:MAG: hypothetical protein NXH95_10425 [Pseudomonadaceae bacterium]|nr:hypothetical protein [Pseudomonadaceae bacterium]